MNRHTISREHWRSVLHNVPRLLFELRGARSLRDLYGFLYFNCPYQLPRASFPVRVTVELTNRCNLACTHCHRYAANEHRAVGEMPVALFGHILEELADRRGTILKIGGWGEPALHPRFKPLLAQCVDAAVPTVVYTNGTLFDRLTLGEILELQHTTIVVSVDGNGREEYERIRVGGNYEKRRTNIGQLFAAKKAAKRRFPLLIVQHVVFPTETAAQLVRFRRSWTPITDMVDFCIYNPFVPAGGSVQAAFLRRCKRVRRELSILYDGEVPVCGPQSKYSGRDTVGNVAASSIAALWNGPTLARVRALHEARQLEAMPLCQSCIYFR